MSKVNISYNGYDIQNSEIVATKIDNYSSSERQLESIPNPKADGDFLVDTQFRKKIITVAGWIKKTTREDAEDKLDEVYENILSVEEKLLEVDYGSDSGTRQYQATAQNPQATANEGKVTVINYTIEFIVNVGYGFDPVDEEFGDAAITDAIHSDSVDIEGSKTPYPSLNLTMTTAGNVDAIELTNTTTNTSMRIAPAGGYNDADIILINSDPENLAVQLNETDIDFTGMILDWELGTNNYQITFEGDFIFEDQSQAETADSSEWSIYDANYQAQSFSPSTNNDCPKIKLFVKKVGIPFVYGQTQDSEANLDDTFGASNWEAQSFTVGASDIEWIGAEIYMKKNAGVSSVYMDLCEDDGGEPGTVLWTKGRGQSTIPTSYVWKQFTDLGNPETLTAATKYWIVMRCAAATNYTWRLDTGDPYAGGNRALSINSGSSWTVQAGQDFNFKVMQKADLDVILYDDDGSGDPDMASAVADGDTTISYDAISTDWSEVDAVFATSPTLALANIYHIVCSRDDSDSGNYYLWKEANDGTYAGGKANRSTDSGTTWSDTDLTDMIFKTYYETGAAGHTVSFAGSYNKLYV